MMVLVDATKTYCLGRETKEMNASRSCGGLADVFGQWLERRVVRGDVLRASGNAFARGANSRQVNGRGCDGVGRCSLLVGVWLQRKKLPGPGSFKVAQKLHVAHRRWTWQLGCARRYGFDGRGRADSGEEG